MAKMKNRRLRNRWIKALRSGRYKQGACCLKTTTGAYCCLGVLANIQGARWVAGEPRVGGKSVGHPHGAKAYLKPRFCGVGKPVQERLSGMNDGLSQPVHTFKQIADYIEKHL